MAHAKRFPGLAIMTLLFFGMVEGLWGLCPEDYNRPDPLMDYVPQEIGIYDTMYWELNEHDCRDCHGNSTADRHHYTPIVLRDDLCTVCHPTCTPGSPDCPDGILIIRDCLTSGCHSWSDVGPKDEKGTFDPANLYNGWHHATDMAASENCVACHNPNLVEEITPFRDLETYPQTVVTPTPFSCENCHWEQAHSATGDPDSPGHPSTYVHYDELGNFIGFHEYSRPIYGNYDSHHMAGKGSVASECYKCHPQDPNNPSWDPSNPELIRYCEICHSVRTLHTIGPHVQDHNGWEAVGFHVAGHPGESSWDNYAPAVYRAWTPTGPPYAPETTPGFTADQQCWGCHGSGIPDPPPTPSCKPAIDTSIYGIQPNHGCCGVLVTLRGECFGAEHMIGYRVQIAEKTCCGAPLEWLDVPAIHAWTSTLIEFEIPCYFIEPGNYWVRVKTPYGRSNKRVFSVEDCPSLLTIDPVLGPCGTWIKFFGEEGDFGTAQEEMFDSYNGVRRIVDFVASSGTYTAMRYRNWNDDSKERSFEVRFYNFFEDGKDTCGEPTQLRNFVQDDGTAVPSGRCSGHVCPDEPTIKKCDCLALGLYSVYVKAIYFGDEDGNGTLNCGDTIFQVAKSNPACFELTNDPIIYKINPRQIERGKRLRIYGMNFGPTQEFGDEVRIGLKKQAKSLDLDQGRAIECVRLWSNTLIKVRMCRLPKKWEGTYKYLWVEKDGMKSNFQRVEILEPLL